MKPKWTLFVLIFSGLCVVLGAIEFYEKNFTEGLGWLILAHALRMENAIDRIEEKLK